MPCLRRKNAAQDITKNRAEGFPHVLPEVQAGEHDKRAELSNRKTDQPDA